MQHNGGRYGRKNGSFLGTEYERMGERERKCRKSAQGILNGQKEVPAKLCFSSFPSLPYNFWSNDPLMYFVTLFEA